MLTVLHQPPLRKFCLVLALLASTLGAQTSRDQTRRADLNFVATQLPKLHANFFFRLNPADFNAEVQALDAQIPNLNDEEYYVRLAALVALAGDEHTLIYLNGSAATKAGFQEFPLQFRWLDDGVFVTAASAAYSRALGTRLVRVGDAPIDDVVRRLATVIPHSNLQWVRYAAQGYLRGQQVLKGLRIVPAGAISQLTFRTPAGDDFTLDVSTGAAPLISAPAPDQGTLPEYLQRSNENYWFTYSAARRLLYFKYNQCVEAPGKPFTAFAAQLLSTFDANPVDTLVFDLRGNPGGDESLIGVLTDGFIARIPELLANPNLRVYVAIDKGTFSAAMDDAMAFKTPSSEYAPMYPDFDANKIIRVIGAPTGGTPEHYGQAVPFSLPGSKLTGQYSTSYFPAPPFITPVTGPDGTSFGPDITVPIRSSDFFARHDPVLAAILARWEGAPLAPSGGAIAVNGASFRIEHGLAPGSFASAFGTFQAGVDQVLLNGQPGRVVSASQFQVNFIVPPSLRPGRATISVRRGSSEIASGEATITPAGPGIFVLQSTDPSQPGAVLNQDSSVNGVANRAPRGSILQIFATGYGPLDSSQRAAVEVFLGGVPAEVLYSGPTAEFPGLWQMNARLPDGVSGHAPMFVVAANIASNGVTVWVQ